MSILTLIALSFIGDNNDVVVCVLLQMSMNTLIIKLRFDRVPRNNYYQLSHLYVLPGVSHCVYGGSHVMYLRPRGRH